MTYPATYEEITEVLNSSLDPWDKMQSIVTWLSQVEADYDGEGSSAPNPQSISWARRFVNWWKLEGHDPLDYACLLPSSGNLEWQVWDYEGHDGVSIEITADGKAEVFRWSMGKGYTVDRMDIEVPSGYRDQKGTTKCQT